MSNEAELRKEIIEAGRRLYEKDFVASNDGNIIRLAFPALTEDRRRELIRLVRSIAEDGRVGLRVTPDADPPPIPSLPQLEITPVQSGSTEEQRGALRVIESWLESGEDGLVLLDADRGRGKSTCLGLLMQAHGCPPDWIVCAASREAARVLLDTAGDARFVAPDRLLDELPSAGLLLVDEAAMIPQALLLQLCRRYPRVILATTTGGYEGTGRGFRLRFVDRLNDRPLLRLSLERPVRWCHGDLLENWIARTLLPGPLAPARSAHASCVEAVVV